IHLWLRRSNGKYPPEIALPRAEKADGTPPPLESFSDTNLSLLLDVELEVTLRFGQRQMPLKDILELGPGSVVELDQQVRDPAELLIGRKVVARGNVVVVDGNYGLQITELASPSERMEFLKR
ncbi:MAG TPA: FliM/FliN family flagellar motor switch protein, partial [Terriglobia bacterium]|nr:FliM/FliN family flagellar motor switch protein [Terriglobia bacterium]